jgi:hypothetical protein
LIQIFFGYRLFLCEVGRRHLICVFSFTCRGLTCASLSLLGNCFPSLAQHLIVAQFFPKRFQSGSAGAGSTFAELALHERSVARIACLRAILSRRPFCNEGRKLLS